MAIAFVNATTVDQSAGSANCTINKPSGAVDDHILYAAIHTDSATIITAPGGWNIVDTASDGTIKVITYKKVAASEGASWQWTSSAFIYLGHVAAWSGEDTTLPLETAAGAHSQNTGNDSTAEALTVTPQGSRSDDLSVATWASWNATSVASGFPPSGYTSRASYGSNGDLMRVAELQLSSSSATGDQTITWSGANNWAGFQVLLVTGGSAAPVVGSRPTVFYPGLGPKMDVALFFDPRLVGDTTAPSNQTFTITLDGLLSPTGALLKTVTKTLAGSLATNSGALLKTITKVLGGSSTPTGALKKTVTKPLAGGSTPTGALVKTTTKVLAGSTTPTGALTKTAGKTLAGSASPTGSLLKTITKVLGGTASPSGALTIIKVIIITLAGSLSPTGSLKKTITKPLGGSSTPTGSLTKTISKFFAGSATPSGIVLKTTTKSFAGSLASVVGTLKKTPTKALGGTTSPTGAIKKTVTKVTAGSAAPSGALLKTITKKFAGTIAPTGAVTLSTAFVFIQQQLRIRVRAVVLALHAHRKSTATARDKEVDATRSKHIAWQLRYRHISIRTVGPEEMLFKAGTAIEFETTFTDADGALYDPDNGTVKLYVKKPDGTYYTGYVPGVSGAVMTKISTGLYRITFQTLRADPVGTWTIETEGKIGAETSLDDIHLQLKA